MLIDYFFASRFLRIAFSFVCAFEPPECIDAIHELAQFAQITHSIRSLESLTEIRLFVHCFWLRLAFRTNEPLAANIECTQTNCRENRIDRTNSVQRPERRVSTVYRAQTTKTQQMAITTQIR